MKGLLIPLVMALLGAGVGGGAAVALMPAAPKEDGAKAAEAGAEAAKGEGDYGSGDQGGEGAATEIVKLNNQFIVPVIEDGRTRSLVVMTLALDVVPGDGEGIYSLEPRLRDAFLRVLFDHAYAGGFEGAFTREERLEPLRGALLERGRAIAGPRVREVLITDVARQET